jgi:hypothetical protein
VPKTAFLDFVGRLLILRGRRGGKRTADEIAQMADAFLTYITANPGQRMEHIARELGLATPELMLPVRKLLVDASSASKGRREPPSTIRLKR